MAYQTRDVVEVMSAASGCTVELLRVDGGASAMDLLLQLQADQLRVPVARPVNQETTAFGAAYLAGLAEGVWAGLDDVTAAWHLDAQFEPPATVRGRRRQARHVAAGRRALPGLGHRRSPVLTGRSSTVGAWPGD